MQKSNILYGVIGIIIGALLVHGFCFMHCRKMNGNMTMNHNMEGTMDGMMANLNGKTGDEFDKAFIKEMIVHHEGAVDMAELALTSAQHPEIKTMANAIITAQTSEISQMKAWLKSWYGEDYQAPLSSSGAMHHGQ